MSGPGRAVLSIVRVDKGETSEFASFRAFTSRGCRVQKTRVDELIAIAEGRKTLEEVREHEAAKKRAHRADVSGIFRTTGKR